MTRVVVFVDYQNAYNLARDAFGDWEHDPVPVGNIFPQRLGMLVRDRGLDIDPDRILSGVRIYRGEPGTQSHAMTQAAFQHQKATWARFGCNTLISRPLKYQAQQWTNGRPTGWSAREKGIDVLLSLDMVAMAHRDEYDVAVLCSADTDLVPAIERVIEAGKRIELVRWQPVRGYGQQLSLPGVRLWTHHIKSADFTRLRDDHDYAYGPRVPGTD